MIEAYGGAIATGANPFSAIDTLNLVRFGGMQRHYDVFQMDAGLSYGITESGSMLNVLESNGFDRKHAIPHGGHLINLHTVVDLGPGACGAYPGVFQPFGGYSAHCQIRHARAQPSDAPGFGLKLTRIQIVVYYGDNIPEQPSANPGQEQWRCSVRWRAADETPSIATVVMSRSSICLPSASRTTRISRCPI